MVMGCLGMGAFIAFLLVLQEKGKQGMEREWRESSHESDFLTLELSTESHTPVPGFILSGTGYLDPLFRHLSCPSLPSSSRTQSLPWDYSATGRLLKVRGLCHEGRDWENPF